MKVMPLQKRNISDSRIVLGCMGFGGEWNKESITEEHILQAEKAIDAAQSIGITMFDHADIYTNGKAEKVFGELLKKRPKLRDEIVIQSKCGIRFADEKGPQRYDFSKDYIIKSVDGILSRLHTDYLDLLLLHRPDPLMEPEVVAEAFTELIQKGKVREFGVSNMSAAQVKLLNTYTPQPMIVNQLELNLKHNAFVESGVLVNQESGSKVNFSDGILEYSRLENIQIQAWSPLAKGMYSGRKLDHLTDADLKTIELVGKMAEQKETTKEAIVLGWLMKHPSMIQPVIGTTNPDRIKRCADAVLQAEEMTREEWYSLFTSARGQKMP
ncbi:aldo/keto reductase [Metabacillus sp. HB246100]|uniref:aldo/keto reductase n=1 Tax=Bacillus weihaiensis TaxID=1547283 RepID=UPI0023551976|nr:aldo/keto reductase [Bacillus weihaiensis]